MKKLISILMTCVLLLSLTAMAAAEPAETVETNTSVSGLFTFEVPDNCLLMDNQLMATLMAQLSEKDYQEQLGMDEEAAQNMTQVLASLDYSVMDVIYTLDFKGNMNVQCMANVGITQAYLPLLKDMFDQQLAQTYISLFGIAEDAILPQEIASFGGNQYYVLYLDVLGTQVHLFITYDAEGNQLTFTFTNMDADTENAILSSIVLANP